MANLNYEKDGKTFLKCKECGSFKEVNPENWYYHNEGFLGVLGRCKQCILKGRKTKHELNMARKRDRDRYYNNPKRREYMFKSGTERRKEKGYGKIHCNTERLIKKKGLRPSVCPVCNEYEGRIIAHHPDYNKPHEIVFCCQICHDKIHKGKILCPQPMDLLKQI